MRSFYKKKSVAFFYVRKIKILLTSIESQFPLILFSFLNLLKLFLIIGN